MEQSEQLEKTFRQLSKAVIIIPIALVILALLFKAHDKIVAYRQQSQPTPTVAPAVVSQVTPITQKPSSMPFKLDLNGPLVCNYDEKGTVANIYIKNKSIYTQFIQNGITNQALVKGDCLYRWGSEQSVGQKTCGIGNYLSLFQTLSAFGALDLNSVIGSISDLSGDPTTGQKVNSLPVNDITKTCVKKDVADDQFAIPNLNFVDKPLMNPTGGTSSGFPGM